MAFRQAGGVLTRRDHPALASKLNRLVRAGAVFSPLPGVYLPSALRDRTEARIAAGARWAGADAVVCGMAAARLSFWPECRVEQVQLAVPGRAKRARPGWAVSQRLIPPELIDDRGSVRITSAALTAIDLAAGPVGGDAIDRVLRSRAASLRDLQQALELTPGRRGNQLRAELLHDSRDEPWSEAERELHRLFRRVGITGWKANVWIGDETAGYFADVLFEAERVIIEVDGYAVHGHRGGFEDDRRRRNALVLAGFLVLDFTWRQIVEEPDWVVGCVRRALSEAGRASGARSR